MTHLFLFTISPVQSFIAQARKTQDLWAGSRMLSAFVEKVYKAIEQEKGKVIFPFKISGSMPNRILASFDFTKTDEELKKLGEKISKAVADELEVLRQKAEHKIGATEYAKIKDAFEKQLKDYFSTFWVFVKVENGNYATAYDKADRLLGAVKNSRTFTQNPEQGRKCSLSGEQNALVIYKSKNLPAFTYDIAEDNKTKIPKVAQVTNPNINEGEGLSAISYIKRFYPFRKDKDKKEFDSTADIALLHTLTELKKIQANGTELFLDVFAKCFSENNIDEIDGQLFFEENFTKKYFEKHNINVAFLDQAKIKRETIQKIARKNNLPFTKYYAILLFDADSMGAWLSGEYLNDRENQLQDFHTHISGLLSNFAEYAKNYVDGNGTDKIKKGRTVYAGGDDYLGFINLHYLFEVMKHLREQFKIQVSDKIPNNGKFTLKGKDEMTFSAGISIAHYKTPLSEVLTWARKMEKEAKDTENKDSFGIAVLKKSGEIHKAVLPFKTVKDEEDIWYSELLREVREGLEKHFSNKYITSLQGEMELLAEKEDTKIIQIMNFEIERLVLRAKNTATKDKAIEMAKKVKQVYEPNKRNIKNFNASLSICDFINRKLQGND
jgi:CRISPR-associated protein Cmr2